MVATALVVVSAVLLVMVSFDILLSKSQKDTILVYLTKAWDWLDNFRTDFFKKKGVEVFLTISGAVFLAVAIVAGAIAEAIDDRHWGLMVRRMFGYATEQDISEFYAWAFPAAHTLILVIGAALCPVLLVYVALGLLVCLEYVVRRTAEYEKGPIVAIGLMLAAVAAVLKAFT